jgi:hypothetical protein
MQHPFLIKHDSSELYEKLLITKTKTKTKTNTNTNTNTNTKTAKTAVIIDPRYDELMQNVIDNFMYFLEPAGWNLLIISITDYQPIIEKRNPNATFVSINKSILYLDETFRYNLSIYAYNKILCNIHFWNQLPTENVLIFQKDCIMYNMFDDIFLNYDFAGANVYVPDKQSMFHGTMNGGFSLRKKTSMIKCLEHVSIENINEYIRSVKQVISMYEDVKNIRQKKPAIEKQTQNENTKSKTHKHYINIFNG